MLSALVYAFLASTALAAPLVKPRADGYKYYFVFGDSYTQTGFNVTDGSPLPSSGNPFGNPTYPGWTSANGPNWIDYLATEYNTTETLVYNFAYGGATIDADLVQPYRPGVVSLTEQIEDLFLSVPVIPDWKPEESLFFFWIGINDIGGSWWAETPTVDTLADAYFALVKKLYDAGARNYLFLDVPPIERAPLTLDQGEPAVSMERAAVKKYNAAVAARVEQLVASDPEVNAKVFATSTTFTQLLDGETVNGQQFANTTGWCPSYVGGTPAWDTFYPECGIPVDEYFWLDNLHPTHLVHKALAEDIAKVL